MITKVTFTLDDNKLWRYSIDTTNSRDKGGDGCADTLDEAIMRAHRMIVRIEDHIHKLASASPASRGAKENL